MFRISITHKREMCSLNNLFSYFWKSTIWTLKLWTFKTVSYRAKSIKIMINWMSKIMGFEEDKSGSNQPLFLARQICSKSLSAFKFLPQPNCKVKLSPPLSLSLCLSVSLVVGEMVAWCMQSQSRKWNSHFIQTTFVAVVEEWALILWINYWYSK